ncbi:MAG: hypothetical protein CVV42_20090 [Candidatus Riflebacteria bacterium HGW-Riflebacteria-2]|jgi:radical SAM protein with 4Fe4S-binding SPASM domain|nr:MAG: hypothetical protein CVV42_20090 [Candidatus Riflebacteria bacterium HGW-Riflebacteria-2]
MFGFQWHLTDRCNRRCRHCYQESFEPGTIEASPGARRKLADAILKAIPNEPVSVNLTGGEPFLLPDLIDLIGYLETFPNLADVSVITNGTIHDSALIKTFGNFPRFSMFKMSVESGNREINDYIRGAGSLETLRRSIPLYRELSSRPVSLMMTLSRANAKTIAETVDFAVEAGAAGIMFERFVPLGTGQGMSEAVLSADDWYRAILAIGHASGLEVDPDDLAACRAFWLWLDRDPEDALDAALCNLGSESMALMPDGTVFPCRRLEIPVGNLFQEPFPAIRRRLADWDCANIRPRLHGDICGVCQFENCPGCRALARALTGDPLADDPQCVLQRD